MSLEEIKRVANELVEAQKTAREYARTRGKEALGAAFLGVLEKFPELAYFGWTQYTPHFNDGEACEFSVNSPFAVPSESLSEGETEVDSEYDFEFGYGDYPKGLSAECKKSLKAVWDVVNNEDMLRDMFGDHVKVRIRVSGVEVEEYDHD